MLNIRWPPIIVNNFGGYRFVYLDNGIIADPPDLNGIKIALKLTIVGTSPEKHSKMKKIQTLYIVVRRECLIFVEKLS